MRVFFLLPPSRLLLLEVVHSIQYIYISFTAEGGVDINQSPKRSKTRNTPHQTLGTSLAPCLRAISTTHICHAFFFKREKR